MDDKCINDFLNQDFVSFSKWLYTLNPYEFTFIATVLGFIISPSLTINEQNSLGNFFELLGQVILTVNAQGSTLKQKRKEKPGIRHNFETPSLEEEILLLKKEIIQLRQDVMLNTKE